MKRNLLQAVLLCAVVTPAAAQISGFVSATRGYHANPLYNYEQVGDQLTQSYMELGYTEATPASRFKVSYVSGLLLFNRFTDRNYYEHSLTGSYVVSPDPAPVRLPAKAGGEDDEEEEPTEPVLNEVTHPALELTCTIGSRHDKSSFREFDNVGAGAGAAYRWKTGEDFALRVSNTIGYRRYIYLSPLSNLTDQLTVEFGVPPGTAVRYGLWTGGGVKHYLETIYDTTRFETVRTFVLKPAGRGKGGGKIKVPSDKQLLLNPESENIFQLVAAIFAELKLEKGSLRTELLFRRNPGRPTRYLAQYVNTSMLSEDIYNDHFSYEGSGITVTLRHALPFSLQGILTGEYQRKQFGAPALNLMGVENGSNRIDKRSSIELYLSRYFELSGGLGLDIAFSGEILRNQSNDDYNDYSLVQGGLSIGVGF